MRVLMANEPRSYREAIAAVVQMQCPEVEVFMVEPEALDAETSRVNPDLVICSQATDLVRQYVSVWVELYPEHRSKSIVSVAGSRSTIEDIQLSDIVSLVAQTSPARLS